ncbi:hypothetical protein [Nonomuraea insulae]|uniref:Uncharacterized protein n=1 Tax=Nonomuraea insulae TaxID=1616787 RepID=A0ABW1D138_9ACTN
MTARHDVDGGCRWHDRRSGCRCDRPARLSGDRRRDRPAWLPVRLSVRLPVRL